MAKIETTHVGSLPRPQELIDASNKFRAGEMPMDDFNMLLEKCVNDVVERQKNIGIDIVNEGEYGHLAPGVVDYGAWWTYSFNRLGGLEFKDEQIWSEDDVVRSTPGNVKLTSFADRRDRERFPDAYNDPESGIMKGTQGAMPSITGKVTYAGQEAVATDVKLLKDAMEKNAVRRGFMAALSPGSAARLKDEFYGGDEKALLDDMADAMAEEYRAITDAGFVVQLDAPDLAESWDQINPEPSVEDYQAWLQLRIDAINRAIAGIDPELVRLHICWGSWHGPHTTDVPFDVIIDQCLQVNAGEFSFEGASARHAHEWKVWKEHPLPEGRKIVPGVVSHSTNVVEHPELVAERIVRFSEVVGPDNVIASTDCGLGGRLHGDIAWAKLESLVEGAQIASKQLFG